MKLETIKSIILVLLISLSLLCTFAIWNYEPHYESADGDRATEAKLAGHEETKKSIIQPSQLLFHEGDDVLGLANKEEEDMLYKSFLEDWSFYDFKMVDFMDKSEVMPDNYVEIIFPTAIPSSLIGDLFTIDDSMVYNNTSFSRMYITMDVNQTKNQIVFENDGSGIDISANIQNIVQVVDYLSESKVNNKFQSYITYQNVNDKPIYLPKDTKIVAKQFRYTTIDPDSQSLQNILFSNPSSVEKTYRMGSGEEVFTDGNRAMVVSGLLMDYENFITSEKNEDKRSRDSENKDGELITQTLNFINSHSGWTAEEEGISFQLFDLQYNADTNRSVFRLTYHNYPIFSPKGLANISVTMRDQSVSEYVRPLVNLTNSYEIDENAGDDVYSSEQLINALENSNQYNSILDIALGYHLEESTGGQVYDLKPMWHIKTYNGWEEFNPVEKNVPGGGYNSAMGTN
ncbi:YycH family regulatory protein [Aquibacillus kalidii]|uniref:YycH family regulatory protein n=1 Tax=Aquibacillus kalidii TaxID=2762597 RepID=UPI001646BBB4|nr:two-component system activity regulator YycH [Aquibacillus kalidii]